MIRKGMTVTYDDFINHISSKKYYDANHIIALLNVVLRQEKGLIK